VGVRQGTDPLAPEGGEVEADDALVVAVRDALDQTGGDGPVDELDGAVVSQQQVAGDVTDRRWRAVTPDGEEQLVLRAGEPDRVGPLLAPALERAQPVPEREEASVVAVTEAGEGRIHILPGYNRRCSDTEEIDNVNEPARFLQVIVVGTDGSDGARRAMEWAGRLATASEACIRAVHVLTYNRELLRDLTPDTMTTWRRDLERELETSWVRPLHELQVPHRCAVVEDESTAAGLIRAADREQADLIVVGARGRSTLAGRVLGSTSYSLTHHAHRPVIVVPPGWRRPAAAEPGPTIRDLRP
jgi:nucleotide-binding universal stress UspA family protein